jgi:hypothetical protein
LIEDGSPVNRFLQRLTGGTELPKVTEYLAVAVPSSEGWEDEDDIHWFYGFTVKLDQEKGLFVRFPTTAGWDSADLTASLLALIELGQEVLGCDHIYLCLKRNPEELGNLVHTLLYVGFEVDDAPIGETPNPSYVILRYETE